MRNNRRLVLSDNFIAENNLSTNPPPPSSLFWTMWNACLNIAYDALATDFIQGIKNANLDPVTYGGFNVNDAYYCFNGAQDYLAAESNATDPTLKAFLHEKYLSYQKYNETFPTIWHVKDAYGVVPSQACKDYSDFESNIASHEESIYTLIVMLPCEYLWAWLGGQLSPPSSGNLYAPWITGNDDPDGAYAMGNYIDLYQQTHTIDENLALKIYTQAMNYELQNFSTAN